MSFDWLNTFTIDFHASSSLVHVSAWPALEAPRGTEFHPPQVLLQQLIVLEVDGWLTAKSSRICHVEAENDSLSYLRDLRKRV